MIELVFNSDMELVNDVDMSAIPWAKITSLDTEVFITIHAVGVVHARVINVYTSENEDYITCIFNMGDKRFSLGINTATGECDINDITPDMAIKLKSGLSSADVGSRGENAYIFVDKDADANALYYEWDIEFLNNLNDVVNLNSLDSAYGGGSGVISNSCITLGGNLSTGDNYQGSIYNISMKKIDDVWTPIFGIAKANGNRVTENTNSYHVASVGRHSYLLPDSGTGTNKMKFDIFSLCNATTGAAVASRWGDWYMYAPAHFDPFYKLYSIKLWSDEHKTTLIHHYVPKIDSDHIGVMDIITNTFYPCSNDNFFELVK